MTRPNRLAVPQGSNATREAVRATCQGFAVGMDAALHINPYYGKTSRDGLIYHFQAVLDYGPVIAYNVPGRTGQDIPDDVVLELAKHPNFAGVKECTGNARIAAYTARGVTCWSGNDDEAHDARWSAGAVGVISVTSNVVPGLMRTLMFDGPDAALNARLQPLMAWLFAQPNPIGACECPCCFLYIYHIGARYLGTRARCRLEHHPGDARRGAAGLPAAVQPVRPGAARAGRRHLA